MAPLKAADPVVSPASRGSTLTRSDSVERSTIRTASSDVVESESVSSARGVPKTVEETGSASASTATISTATRPVLPPDVQEFFLPSTAVAGQIVYRPALLGQARVHFVDTKNGIDLWDPVTLVRLLGDSAPEDPWAKADEWSESDLPELLSDPEASNAAWRPVPAELLQKKAATSLKTALKNHLYRDRRLTLMACEELKQVSGPNETEAGFRARLRHVAREERDREVEKLRRKYGTKLSRLEDKLRRAEQKIEREEAQKSSRTISAVVNVGTSMLGALLGRKRMSVTNVSRAGSAARAVTGASAQAADVRHAQEQRTAVVQEQEELNAELQHEIEAMSAQFDTDLMKFTAVQLSPRKADTSIEQVTLLWLPYADTGEGRLVRAF
jgi:hypothetical protein